MRITELDELDRLVFSLIVPPQLICRDILIEQLNRAEITKEDCVSGIFYDIALPEDVPVFPVCGRVPFDVQINGGIVERDGTSVTYAAQTAFRKPHPQDEASDAYQIDGGSGEWAFGILPHFSYGRLTELELYSVAGNRVEPERLREARRTYTAYE